MGGTINTEDSSAEDLADNLVDDISLEYRLNKRDNMFLKAYRTTRREHPRRRSDRNRVRLCGVRKKLSRLKTFPFQPQSPEERSQIAPQRYQAETMEAKKRGGTPQIRPTPATAQRTTGRAAQQRRGAHGTTGRPVKRAVTPTRITAATRHFPPRRKPPTTPCRQTEPIRETNVKR